MKLKWPIWTAVVVTAALFILPIFAAYTSNPLPEELQNRLIQSTRFEVLALNHISVRFALVEMVHVETNSGTLLDYPILGSVQITNQDLSRELVAAVSYDISHANHLPSNCILEPRHGIRCTNGTNSILIAICYQCGDVLVQENGKESDYLIKGNGQSPASRRVFERIFKQYGIKEDAN